MSKMVKEIKKSLLLLITGLGLTNSAVAVEILPDLQMHGFFSQVYLRSNENQFFGDSDEGSFEFYELGVNLTWQPLDRIRLAGQMLIRDAGTSDDGRPRVDYLFSELNLFETERANADLRFGRMLIPYGFYNETRDVIATRPGILLPQSVYIGNYRSFAISADGLLGEFTQVFGDSQLSISAFGYKPRDQQAEFEYSVYQMSVPGEIVGSSDSWTLKAQYEYDLGRIRIGFTAGEVLTEYKPAARDFLLQNEQYFKPLLLSFQYNAESWSFTSEILRRTSGARGPNIGSSELTGTSGYVQMEYRWKAATFYSRYDLMVRSDKDPWGKKYQRLTGRPDHSRFAKDLTIGARWDLTHLISLHAELHHVDGTAWLSLRENEGYPRDRQWNLFLFSASARF